ncbi:phosphatidylinositol kinase [Burkholderia cepacia]|uniref:phosphatidylinositol kinase n=1 Tax=Burkholderia cepacia TaxID=292 RepID=UPI000F5DE76C|nr:phosphatidylinositol kinase [Burkholderia cepacia]
MAQRQLGGEMYPVIEVPVGSAELFEQLGTKEKFWYADVYLGPSLFKRGRPNTGENWAEKLACELADALGIPHAYYELARCGEQAGVVSPTFVPEGARLIHGNELLAKTTPYQQYADAKPYRSRAHTITLLAAFVKVASESKIIRVPIDYAPRDGIETVADIMVGYLMLDAWIGNQDRHDQNWGVILDPKTGLYLAPSFDHGSSFARNLQDEACDEMLSTRDMGRHISTFVQKARSGLYPRGATEKTKTLLTIEAFLHMAKLWPTAARAWLARLEAITPELISNTVGLLPDDFASPHRRAFLVEFLNLNRKRLLSLDIGQR